MDKIVRRSIAALAVVTAVLVMTGAAASATDDENCADFTSQQAAQVHLNQDTSDPDGLDHNHNGQACEEWSYSSATSTDGATPTGGVNTGFGGMADHLAPGGSQDHIPLVAGAATAIVGIGWTTTRRRRQA